MEFRWVWNTIKECSEIAYKHISMLCGFQIMMSFGISFGYIVADIFGAFRMLMEDGHLIIIMAFITFFWAMFHISVTFFIIYKADSVKSEAKKIAVLVHKHANYERDPKILKKIILISQQILERTPTLTCGLFTFDLNLVFSVRIAGNCSNKNKNHLISDG